ncbi:UDP-N-acetylmuramoyl-L-alanyl-D-glutamate--2,6-diaminopimelate ligase [Pigmentibacter sp. JX0631]|uniref:UDP-N-acetylmuramoyl-L-alanyl-D-glutamate--2, 6-diaminopimelate ligase n=1 Tax=Pigmentibacter sp. JX0631 TaxID=2976982 RepID=UPI0024697A36|nr:UDP-N-acetylmuramoyl-L-alanyl-D-glutamate--2,6-diaminopimelate ligase [Pigmentibacter sp. JX0631]WGL61445.1 UDP-N-acetylmuramoyl-L-alanyl-D-glutamate--2,6-diaminopimelate ligase [Pigmentibacter sp. JX0631]
MLNSIILQTPHCTAEELNRITSKKVKNSKEDKFEIVINSKELHKYKKNTNTYIENSFVYFARVGNKFDGNSLIEEILNSNNYIVSTKKNLMLFASKNRLSDEVTSNILSHEFFLVVENMEESINKILEIIFKIDNQKFNTIAVTGTNGKTSTVQICSQIYENVTKKSSLRIGTLGLQIKDKFIESSHVTTPDYPTFLQILNYCNTSNINQIIMETTSHGLSENRIGKWLVDIAIFTNLTQDHLDYHGTMESYRDAKLRLFKSHLKHNGCAIFCLNNSEWNFFCEAAKSPSRTAIGIGEAQQNKIFFEKYSNQFKNIFYIEIKDSKSNLSGNFASIIFKDQEKVIKEFEIKTPLIGQFQLYNILCSVAAMIYKEFEIESICESLINLKNIPGRLEVVKDSEKEIMNQPTVIIDYAHSPDALEKAIHVCLEILKTEEKGNLVTVFGCGGDRDKSKRPLMGQIATSLSHRVIVTSDNPRTEDPDLIIDDIFSGITTNSENCIREKDRKKAIELAINSSTEFDIVLVAGKGHEDYQIIGDKKFPFSDPQIALSILKKEKF